MNAKDELSKKEIGILLKSYGIGAFEEYKILDSSHGEKDLRHNYIIDKKYVLRVNSAKVMTEERLKELNTLVKRYNDFGMKAPYFIPNTEGRYLIEYKNCYCYLSEYLDYEIAYDIREKCWEELIKERAIFVAKFANQYKDHDLIETKSMYSLFELSPYDQLKGMDEKQENFNNLINDLNEVGEHTLANKLKGIYDKDRKELLSFYQELPKCVFQGDENFSNLCVDDNNHIIGLFDFNMSGTEVIANYLANIAFQGNFYYTDEIIEQHSAQEIFEMIMSSYKGSTELIKQYYEFGNDEMRAYEIYSKIVMISGYVNQAAFSEFMRNEKYRDKIIELLYLIESALKAAIVEDYE